MSSSTVWPFTCGLISATSGTVARDRLGCVQGLFSPKVAAWGDCLHRYFCRFRYALTIRHGSILGALTYFMLHTLLLCGAVDLLVFLIILITARRSGTSRLPGISTILDAILQDATVFFLLIAASQLVLCLFLFFAPVGDPY